MYNLRRQLRLLLSFTICLICMCQTLNLGQSTLRQMWMTPIQIYALGEDNASSQLLDSVLNSTVILDTQLEILSYYENFVNTKTEIVKDATLSDLFFLYQQNLELEYKLCLRTHSSNPCVLHRPAAFDKLSRIFHSAVLAYLRECYLEDVMEVVQQHTEPSLHMSIWTSIHGNGSYHSPHHHKSSMLSGILYLSTPPGSGAVVFEDPRGSLPPFGKTLHIVPKVGQLIIFPSWLVHSVLPSLTSTPRISVSFNYDGQWEATSDINQGYYA